MALWIPRRLACMAVVAVLAMVKPSQGQTCSSEKMENITVDILLAFSKGLRRTDPVYTHSWEACVGTCCSETVAGDKPCNYVVFYPKKKSLSPNCYLFYYPDKEACPMKQAFGLVTYRMIKDQGTPGPSPPPLSKLSNPTANGSLVLDLGHPPPGQDPLQNLVASKTGGNFGHAKQPLEEVGVPSRQPSPERVRKLGSSPEQDNSTLQQAATSGSQARETPTVTPRISDSRPPTQPPEAGGTRGAADQPGSTTPPQPSVPFKSGLPQFSLWTSSLPAPISSAPGRGSHLRNRPFSLEDGASENEAFLLGDQPILLAVLCFGVLFFLLATVLTGRKMLDLLHQRQYAELDYLINDMYAKM